MTLGNRLLSPLRFLVIKYPSFFLRLFEILPGFVSWSLILFPVWGSLVAPIVVAYYIITFDVYWFYRSISMAVFAIMSYYRMKASIAYDWMSDVNDFEDYKKVRHVVVIPTYKEPAHTLVRTLEGLEKQEFPSKQIIPVIAFEERAGEEINKPRMDEIRERFKDTFDELIFSVHPANIPGELIGKSSNAAWAAKTFVERMKKRRDWDMDYMTITSEDSDVVIHKNYFAELTFKFLDNPERYHRIWQGAVLYYNNIADIPWPMRVFNRIASVFQLALLARQDRLVNFSTYSMSLRLMDQMGYWDTDVIPEDYRTFFKAYFATHGQTEVEPIFLPVTGDAAESNTFWSTFDNTYQQVKRWAWGASDDAYIIDKYIRDTKAPFWDKTLRVFKVLEDHMLWPVNWFVVTLGATLPPLLNEEFSRTIIGKTLPQIASGILTLSLVSLLVMVFVESKIRPDLQGAPWWKKVAAPLELIILPLVGFFFSALPGLEAHTRLMMGKYIEYRVTEKV